MACEECDYMVYKKNVIDHKFPKSCDIYVRNVWRMRSYFSQLLRIGSYSSQVGITRTGNNKVLHSFDTNLEFTFHIFLGNCSCKEVTPRYSTHALASPPFNLSICFDVNVQSPMQSCRSLRPLSISANVSKVVQ